MVEPEPKRRSYSEEELRNAVASCISWSGVLKKLGRTPAGGNYAVLKRRISNLGLDVGHFLGQGHLKGKRAAWVKGIELERLLVEDCPYRVTTYHLKNKLLRANMLTRRCGECHLSQWLGQPIPLELDHRNGDRTDNKLKNLRLLCPNCHALTPTYRSKNTARLRSRAQEQTGCFPTKGL